MAQSSGENLQHDLQVFLLEEALQQQFDSQRDRLRCDLQAELETFRKDLLMRHLLRPADTASSPFQKVSSNEDVLAGGARVPDAHPRLPGCSDSNICSPGEEVGACRSKRSERSSDKRLTAAGRATLGGWLVTDDDSTNARFSSRPSQASGWAVDLDTSHADRSAFVEFLESLCQDLASLFTLDAYLSLRVWLRSLNPRSLTVERVIQSAEFDYVTCAVIVLNSILIGVQTEIMARDVLGGEPSFVEVFSYLFAIFFTGELLARLWVFRSKFFLNANFAWNMFDLVVVISQLLDIISSAVTLRGSKLSLMRVVRICRLLRVLRLLRIFHMVTPLRRIVMSISRSMAGLVWTISLLLLIIYVVAVFFTQTVTEKRGDVDLDSQVERELVLYYGSLQTSFFTFFACIMNGVNWADASQPLFDHLSPVYGIIFCFYIAFTLLTMMNVVTGVFVETAIKGSEEEEDDLAVSAILHTIGRAEERRRNGRRRTVGLAANFSLKSAKASELNYGTFKELLGRPESYASFKHFLGVDAVEADQMFRLLDVDESGCIDPEEYARACRKLKKVARAIDLETFMYESRKKFGEQADAMEHYHKDLLKLQDLMATMPQCIVQLFDDENARSLHST